MIRFVETREEHPLSSVTNRSIVPLSRARVFCAGTPPRGPSRHFVETNPNGRARRVAHRFVETNPNGRGGRVAHCFVETNPNSERRELCTILAERTQLWRMDGSQC